MTTETPDLRALAERLEKLEKEKRRLQNIAGGVSILFAVVILFLALGVVSLFALQLWPGGEDLKAGKIVLVDADGNDRMILSAEGESPSLVLLHANGNARAELKLNENGLGVLQFSDEAGERRVILESAGAQTASALAFHDRDGKRRIALTEYFGIPELVVNDEFERPRVAIGENRGRAELRLLDSAGKDRVRLAVEGDEPVFDFMDGGGRARLSMSLNAGGDPEFEMLDPEGQPVFQAPRSQ